MKSKHNENGRTWKRCAAFLVEVKNLNAQNLLTTDHIIADGQKADYTDQLVILKQEHLKEAYKSSRNQIWLCTHGPGCKEGSFTGTIHLTHPIDKDMMCVHRGDVLGIIKPEVLLEVLEENDISFDISEQDEDMCQ